MKDVVEEEEESEEGWEGRREYIELEARGNILI
jgi:hypothetical protein